MSKNLKDIKHWKDMFDYKYLGVYSLESEGGLTRVIKNITLGVEVKGAGGTISKCNVIDFTAGKPMILNKVNSGRLTAITGSPAPVNWIGLEVRLVAEMDRSFTGGKDWALRIDPKYKKVATKKKLQPLTAKGFDDAKTAVLKGSYTVANIQSSRLLTKEQLAGLKAAEKEFKAPKKKKDEAPKD